MKPWTIVTDLPVHRIRVSREICPGVRALIEGRLGIETWGEPDLFGKMSIYFHAPADVDLDFLRPDVLPPE